MKKIFPFSLTAMLILAIALSGCGGGSGGGSHETTYTPGQSTTCRVGGVSFKMNYVPGATFASDDSYIISSTSGGATGSWFPTQLTVTNAFWCAETEVTYELWDKVKTWAITSKSYSFANAGSNGSSGSGNDQPVTTINWRDAMIWCNALTEYYYGNSENCVYYTDAAYTTPLRISTNDPLSLPSLAREDNPYIKAAATGNTDMANCTAKGFRLPTHAEWELAARYIDGTNWKTGDYASGATAIYSDAIATSAVAVYKYATAGMTDPTGTAAIKSSKKPNALGLYDISGNVWEWCFDWVPSSYAGFKRTLRGGSWCCEATTIQLAIIAVAYPNSPVNSGGDVGFRPVRTN